MKVGYSKIIPMNGIKFTIFANNLLNITRIFTLNPPRAHLPMNRNLPSTQTSRDELCLLFTCNFIENISVALSLACLLVFFM